jgi:Nif-specific regulatory protein
MAVPLQVFGRVRGVIYLDSTDPAARFDRESVPQLQAIGAIVAAALENARRVEELAAENRQLKAEMNVEHGMVGDSPRIRRIYEFISKVASNDSTVLIEGESGTGKELVARAIHRGSARASKPFVAINCAALTETLLESELFGHEKGSFTGAFAQKKGKLEEATTGTVFLDEIGELAPTLQAKLLRVLQERELERVGGTRPIKIDIRVIAATNRNLKAATETGAFRQDLYFRLNVVSLHMPPLRERREDIPKLATHFVQKHGRKAGRRVTGISPDARACLMSYEWPGNVRELENAIERAVVLGSTELVLREDLPEQIVEANHTGIVSEGGYYETVMDAKKQVILKTLDRTHGNVAEAARILGFHPNNLHRMIRNLNLKTATRR